MSELNSEIFLETNMLSKKIGGIQIINQVNIQIRRGEIHCVIGPNGAGKSTFFKLLTGEYSRTSGDIYFLNQCINKLPPFKRIKMGMGIKFQIPGIFPELTVNEHLKLSLSHLRPEIHKTPNDIDILLQRFNLTDEYKQFAGNLSHGKKQWLEIAMAVSLQPKILMLDEPVAGLSIDETYVTGELIKQMQSEGLTLIVIEHDMTFVRQIASQVTVLHGGQVFADGNTDQVLAREDVARIYLGNTI
ncbi:ABC transporter ATP-binding protein [Providencia burhodogranariea]|uniref:ABC transporter ATPase n=1 Tax=Providencia burhodogranariea DSM 19968 TaxID=1141662 RepID=K8WN23_9GAMM|nr:ABC transporter ATPase [Providencia burhodogranariea DSM 19968]